MYIHCLLNVFSVGLAYKQNEDKSIYVIIGIGIIFLVVLFVAIIPAIMNKKEKDLEAEILQSLGLSGWMYNAFDALVNVKSSQAVSNYTDIKYFTENRQKLGEAAAILNQKSAYAKLLNDFLVSNTFTNRFRYSRIEQKIRSNLTYTQNYSVVVNYTSPAGRKTNTGILTITPNRINELRNNPALLMSKTEYNKYIKEQEKNLLEKKQHKYYDRVNRVIDTANDIKDKLVIHGDSEKLDALIAALFDRTVNSIKKIKTIKSEEWDVIDKFLSNNEHEVDEIIKQNKQITDYYNSPEFMQIKSTCDSLMSTQREFNEYIDEKAKSIQNLFGVRVTRDETVVEDEYNYIRPYKKSITPFTAEVSAAVFASAENNPLDYIVKYFYPNKSMFPEQIQKLQLLVEELETLKEAKQIIENYKKDYQQYIVGVPSFIMENDEDGFYSRLGFANVSESVLTVAYKFSYTSGGGMAQRSFTVPMTEETIVELIKILESKLTFSAFAKEQRSLMTSKLRQMIKERDDYTCKYCGNSTHAEPNLLLEIDHIIPVAKGGFTEEKNLQTLCWKCNRHKGSRLV